MKNCPFCNAEIAENARFCLHCMATLEEKEKIQIPTNNKRWIFHLSAALVFISILTIVLLIVEKNLTPNTPPKEVSTAQSTYENVSSYTNTSHTLVSNSSAANSEITDTDSFESSTTKKPKKANSSNSSSVKASSKNDISNASSKKSNSSSSKATSVNSVNSSSSSSENASSSSSSEPPAPPFTYTLIDNEIHIVKGNENLSGAINVPNTIDGYPVTQILDYAFSENTKITSVTIPKNVECIGHFAFVNCKNLAVVNFSEGLKYIRSNAFSGCNIKTLILPDSIIYINGSAFIDCENLTNVILPNNLEIIELALFEGCTNLNTITLPKELKLVGDMAFQGCNNLTAVYYPGSEADREKIEWECHNHQLDHITWYYEVER